jgi:SAM-dependent methyltransferase
MYQLPDSWTDRFDWILSYDVIHDLHDSVTAVREIRRILKPGGLLSNMEPLLHSSHYDNREDPHMACRYYTVSMHVCLPCSMTSEPHAGHGACWGMEDIEEFLKANGSTIVGKYKISDKLHFVNKFE